MFLFSRLNVYMELRFLVDLYIAYNFEISKFEANDHISYAYVLNDNGVDSGFSDHSTVR